MNRWSSLLSSLLVLAGCGGGTSRLTSGDDAGSLTMCSSDSQCALLAPSTPRCDKNSGKCVPCLPLNDNCPLGQRCAAVNDSYACGASCAHDIDCPKSDAGTSLSCCNGACLDTSFDTQNCGACGKVCPTLNNASTTCQSGSCTLRACDTGYLDCNNLTADGCEVATATDPKNCGHCGDVCGAGPNQSAACAAGTCSSSCATGYADCNMNSGDGCEVNTTSDINNCGACAKSCGNLSNATATCTAGNCAIASCNFGFADCNNNPGDGCEVTLATDTNNCGTCGKSCAAGPNSVAACKAGACVIASCVQGFADCDGLANDGCETAVSNDPKNCGNCGLSCTGANSVQGCQAGACTIMSCTSGFADCDSNPQNGCEAMIASDPSNCGGCGKVCTAPANSTVTCTNATCAIGACKFGYADCNNNPSDGCEANLLAPANCGKCGNVCAAPANATAGCNGGTCGIGACNALYGDCDMNAANGCEKSLAVDVANCGACGHACSAANATSACLNGVCGISKCNTGFADCDGNAANGCEVNTTNDPKNCGKCANVCGVNAPNCSAGACANQYLPVGPQTNVPIANLAGWTQCFLDQYGDESDPTLAQIQTSCSKAKLMLACRPTNSTTLTLLAWAPRADVLFDTGAVAMSTNTHVANGTGWYYSTGLSWGFAPAADPVDKNTCDILASSLDATGTDPTLRLCWHTNLNNGTLDGGWRCGSTDTLSTSAAWERVIYQAD